MPLSKNTRRRFSSPRPAARPAVTTAAAISWAMYVARMPSACTRYALAGGVAGDDVDPVVHHPHAPPHHRGDGKVSGEQDPRAVDAVEHHPENRLVHDHGRVEIDIGEAPQRADCALHLGGQVASAAVREHDLRAGPSLASAFALLPESRDQPACPRAGRAEARQALAPERCPSRSGRANPPRSYCRNHRRARAGRP